ncbi:hypothetical protein IBX73_07650 [candidate division WOR-3 bacterium]|nr:hypothetical protein [candidate division WOR-3 bacterium]
MAKKDISFFDENYMLLLKEVKSKILSARISAARKVNKELIKLYWDIGKTIVGRQKEYGWGKSVIEKLAKDLKREFRDTEGFSSRNLWYMRCLYLEYDNKPILQQPVAEIPWGHNIMIFTKVKDAKAREYYLKSATELGWSRNVLLNQIKADAYRLAKAIPKQHNFPKALPAHLAEQADESLKSVYNFCDFRSIC